MRTFCFIILLLFSPALHAQDLALQIGQALNKLEADDQFRHAQVSMYVTESKTGKVIFERNARVGMAPASCQKIFTSAAALDMLGESFRFDTRFYMSTVNSVNTKPFLVILPSGDPTTGSERFPGQKDLMEAILTYCTSKGVTELGGLILEDDQFDINPIPDGWIWQDIGNYFGAGAWALNWQENKTSLRFRAGSTVGSAALLKNTSALGLDNLINEVRTGPAGSGDQTYVYAFPYSKTGWIKGTVPLGAADFSVSASIPDPVIFFADSLRRKAAKQGIQIGHMIHRSNFPVLHDRIPEKGKLQLESYPSPELGKINDWFMKKSINLYGEALVKAIGLKNTGRAVTDSGIKQMTDYWAGKGIAAKGIRLLDGSGLSPSNRVTAQSLVQVLEYAAKSSWYTVFYQSLPVMNGLRMKDGYISGVRTYAGYIKSSSGKEYTFSFMANHFTGNPSAVREKMWQVLNVLK